MRFFFYGTLLDPDVTALVLGRRLPPSAFLPARLSGYVRRRAVGKGYPVLARRRGGSVSGAVVGGLTARDVARLAAYEGPNYRIAALPVRLQGRLVTVSVFEPNGPGLQPSADPWDLAAWQSRHKRAFVAFIRPLAARL
jgi:hypothetical protein